jgi:hypothetical protein
MAGPQKPQYPHLEQITDPFAKMSLRLLWDAHRELQASQAALSTTVDTHAATLTSQQAAIDDATFLAQQAQSTTGKTVSASPNNIPIGTPQTPTTDLDNGMGEQGCSSSGSNGHVDPSAPVTPFTMGQITCGVGKEFPNLLISVATQPERDAQRFELLGRMIWHLNLAGFTAVSRYPGNPFDLLVQIGDTQFAYRVIDYADAPDAMQTTVVFGGTTVGGTTTPDAGIAD